MGLLLKNCTSLGAFVFRRTNQKFSFVRLLYSQSNCWEKKYKKQTRIELEIYWTKRLSEKWKEHLKSTAASPSQPLGKEKFYCLSMFPYPSGKLHMGHVRVYTISDTMAHYHRMQGRELVHPMGWDSFGLPAENAALLNQLDPKEWTEKNIAFMKQQLNDLNLFFDWNRELSTCNPDYYKWTQYLFVKLFQAGLAYQKKSFVNWDPVDRTVLADEQVDEEGCSWRSGALVEKRLLKQWFLRTRKYAKSLLASIDEIDEHVGIKAMQRNWIGQIDGCFVDFKLQIDGVASEETVSIFCSHPELIHQATHVNIPTKHCSEFAIVFKDAGATSSITDLLQSPLEDVLVPDIKAINPFTNERIPFIVSNHQEEIYKCSNTLGIPSLNEKDKDLSMKHKLSCGNHQMVMSREEALNEIEAFGFGQGHMTSSAVNDWLISRQRRWGTPIPISHCPEHGAVAVAEQDLPVLLPRYDEDLEKWKITSCPKCGRPAVRETDTMDTFVDSSWYFLRFTDPHNEDEIFSKDICNNLMPVDLYIGGKEHAILHLYYARFITHFCADIGLTVHREPFKKLLAQGIIKGKTYRHKESGKYLSPSEVVEKDSSVVEASSGNAVEVSFEKMSKSKLNGVDPHDFVAEWGINLTRLFVLYAAAPQEIIHWDVKTDVIPGMMRWQMKLWRNVGKLLDARAEPREDKVDFDAEFALAEHTNRTIEQVTRLFETCCTLSAAITSLMTLARATSNTKDSVVTSSAEFERSVCAQVIMTAPMMPHFASELWTGLCGMKYKLTDHAWDREVLDQRWPVPSSMPTPSTCNVWVDTKHCVKLRFPQGFLNKEEIRNRALVHPKVVRRLKGRPIADIQHEQDKIVFLTAHELSQTQ